jgi:predicted metal-dependent hydrolase
MPKPALPAALEDFVDLFNKGAFWEAHEALEAPWKRTRSDFYHGLILYSSAWVHQDRGNPHGIQAQLAKAEPLLREYSPGYLGIDVSAILEQGRELSAGRAAKAPMIITDLKLVRGDEPELEPGS